MRTRWLVLALAAVLVGALGGAMLTAKPTGAVSKDMIQLQEQVSQLLQGQRDLRSAIDTNNATLRTLVQQSLDATNQLNSQMGVLQKSVQEATANSGSRIDTMSTQTQGLSDNMQDVQARVAKLGQQMNDIQGLLQSIDGKISGGVSAPQSGYSVPPGSAQQSQPNAGYSQAPQAANPVPSMPAVSADTLYQNALRDFSTGKYDLARQEFSDYAKNFPANDLASNAQFYLGEISYAQGDYQDAIAQYEIVIGNYPKSFKLAAAQLKKAFAEIELGMKSTGIRDLREVLRRFPGSDEARRAQAKLKELGASTAPRAPAH
ncbi:MAG: tol-pal system protein YbgF [Candidatus Acidiferrales bacterium]